MILAPEPITATLKPTAFSALMQYVVFEKGRRIRTVSLMVAVTT